MNFTKLNHKSVAISLLALSAVPLSALAALPATSPYVTDPQNTYVQDATSDGISNLNMVLCIMDSMKPADMVNKGDYIALVDKNKCDTKSQSSASNSTSGSSGATSAPDYMTAVVNVTRASATDPMIGKIWMSMTEEGHAMDIYVHLTATQSPTDAPPYGKFRLDYIGKASSTTQFNGFIDANGADVNYLETGGNSSNNALALTATSTTAGSGTMTTVDQNTNNPVTFNFAYDSDETANGFPAGIFRRSDGTNDICFDRSKANAHKSVWRYGTYNANDGTRVDQANPGFPVLASYGGNTYYGYASYWGVNFQGLDLNSFADGTLSGVTVTDQRPGNSTTYTLSKSQGKLTKWTQNSATLSDMDGIPFTFWGDITGLTNNGQLTGFGNWQMQWNNANGGNFTVIGTQTCGNNGCVETDFSQPEPVITGKLSNIPISGWSNAFGGNINIPPTTNAAHTSTDAVNYFSQSDVIPGDSSAPTALYCLSNCPTAASLAAFTGSNTPFGNNTDQQWNSGTTSVSYTYGSSGLVESSTVLAVSNASVFTGQYQNGIQSGRLFDAPLLTSGCPNGGTVCEPGNPSVYYTWQTGPNQWNQSMWLTKASDSTVVQFDPPENVAYTVPSDSAVYGSWAGKTIQLQFNGFGNLQGIPGGCVNPTDNTQEDCGIAGARYVPAFSVPDGATMTLTGSNTPIIVKALDAELRLSKVSCAATATAQPSTAVTMPSATDVHDPSDPADVDYLGVKPTVTDPPKVISGVIQ